MHVKRTRGPARLIGSTSFFSLLRSMFRSCTRERTKQGREKKKKKKGGVGGLPPTLKLAYRVFKKAKEDLRSRFEPGCLRCACSKR